MLGLNSDNEKENGNYSCRDNEKENGTYSNGKENGNYYSLWRFGL